MGVVPGLAVAPRFLGDTSACRIPGKCTVQYFSARFVGNVHKLRFRKHFLADML